MITCNLDMGNLIVTVEFSEMDLFLLQQEYPNDFDDFEDGGEVYREYSDIVDYCNELYVYRVFLPDSTEITVENDHIYIDQQIVYGQFNVEELFDYTEAYDSRNLPILHAIAYDLHGNYAKAADIVESGRYIEFGSKRAFVEDMLIDANVPDFIHPYIDIDAYFDDHVEAIETNDGRFISYYD